MNTKRPLTDEFKLEAVQAIPLTVLTLMYG